MQIPSQNELAAALGIKPREAGVIRWAIWARTQVPNGFYLCSDGQRAAAERMIARGFLTRAPSNFSPPVNWITVVLNPENVDAINAAAASKSEAA